MHLRNTQAGQVKQNKNLSFLDLTANAFKYYQGGVFYMLLVSSAFE